MASAITLQPMANAVTLGSLKVSCRNGPHDGLLGPCSLDVVKIGWNIKLFVKDVLLKMELVLHPGLDGKHIICGQKNTLSAHRRTEEHIC